MYLQPASPTVYNGGIFIVDIMADAWTYPVHAVEIHLTFDKNVVQVVDAAGNPAGQIIPDVYRLDQVLANTADNAAGTIRYEAGDLVGTPPTGVFRIARIRLKALTLTTATPIGFVNPTNVYSAGVSVLSGTLGAQVRIVEPSCVLGKVTLQGHSTPLGHQVTVGLLPSGGLLWPITYVSTLDADGQFPLCGQPGGLYNVYVKGQHSLRNVRPGVGLPGVTDNAADVAALPVIDLCTLLEGDASGDDRVASLDLSMLIMSYGKSTGDVGFNPQTDFNDDGKVNTVDFSLLSSNWALQGPIVCPSGQPGRMPSGETAAVAAALGEVAVTTSPASLSTEGAVGLKLAPAEYSGKPGDIVALDVLVEAGTQPINNVEMHISFDPHLLQVVDGAGQAASEITADLTTLTGVLLNTADNATGEIRYDAMQTLGGTSPSGSFRIATIRMKLLSPTPGTAVEIGWDSEAFYDGYAVTGNREDATVVSGGYTYLPIIMK